LAAATRNAFNLKSQRTVILRRRDGGAVSKLG